MYRLGLCSLCAGQGYWDVFTKRLQEQMPQAAWGRSWCIDNMTKQQNAWTLGWYETWRRIVRTLIQQRQDLLNETKWICSTFEQWQWSLEYQTYDARWRPRAYTYQILLTWHDCVLPLSIFVRDHDGGVRVEKIHPCHVLWQPVEVWRHASSSWQSEVLPLFGHSEVQRKIQTRYDCTYMVWMEAIHICSKG